jgi:hypothetical protein
VFSACSCEGNISKVAFVLSLLRLQSLLFHKFFVGIENNLMSLEAFRLLKCQNGRMGMRNNYKIQIKIVSIETVKSTVFLAIPAKGRSVFGKAYQLK